MTDEESGPQRLHKAIRAALEVAGQAGKLQASNQKALEATLATLDERLGIEPPEVRFDIEQAPDDCLVAVHTSDPVAHDVVASFLHNGGARKLGTAKVWLLPLDEIPVTRWARGLRKVIAATRRTDGEARGGLPIRLTFVWSQDGEMTIGTLR